MTEKKQNTGFLYGVIGILIVLLAITIYILVDTNKKDIIEDTNYENQQTQLILRRDSLETELYIILQDYDSLQTDNLDLQKEIIVQKEKINGMLKLRADDAYKIAMYEKEMKTLRSVLRSYIVQIDSLNTMNIALKAENRQLRDEGQILLSQKSELETERKQLLERVTSASALVVSDINVFTLNTNEKQKKRLRTKNIFKIQTDFIVRSNITTSPGSKTIYLRIIRPDGTVLGSPENLIVEDNENALPASAKRTITYENEDVTVTIYWTNDGDLVPGLYSLELYCEGFLIGSKDGLEF